MFDRDELVVIFLPITINEERLDIWDMFIGNYNVFDFWCIHGFE